MHALRFGLAALGLAVALPAAAQNYVASAMTSVASDLRNEGYRTVALRTRAALTEGQARSFVVRLQGGRTYAFRGVCDEDCHDLDLMVYDNRGNLVEQDASDDDVPQVMFTPRNTGRFRITVRMYNCDQEPCAFGVVGAGQ